MRHEGHPIFKVDSHAALRYLTDKAAVEKMHRDQVQSPIRHKVATDSGEDFCDVGLILPRSNNNHYSLFGA
jgi:hypothetical protein